MTNSRRSVRGPTPWHQPIIGLFAGTGALTVTQPHRPDAGRISTTMSCAATFHPMNGGPSSGMDMTVVTFLGIDGAEEIAATAVT